MNLAPGTDENLIQPGRLFAERLREARKSRGFSLERLAATMKDEGLPIGKASLVRIENGSRAVTLDEAIGLATVLDTSLAHMMTPPEGAWLSPRKGWGVDSSSLRPFLLTGFGVPPDPETRRTKKRVWMERSLTAYATALSDALRIRDKAGQLANIEAILDVVRRYGSL